MCVDMWSYIVWLRIRDDVHFVTLRKSGSVPLRGRFSQVLDIPLFCGSNILSHALKLFISEFHYLNVALKIDAQQISHIN